VFSLNWKISLNETTVRSIWDAYHLAFSKKIKLGDSTVKSKLLEMRHRRCKLISDNMDKKLQAYIKNIRTGGGNI